jgi:hypothetical protein
MTSKYQWIGRKIRKVHAPVGKLPMIAAECDLVSDHIIVGRSRWTTACAIDAGFDMRCTHCNYTECSCPPEPAPEYIHSEIIKFLWEDDALRAERQLARLRRLIGTYEIRIPAETAAMIAAMAGPVQARGRAMSAPRKCSICAKGGPRNYCALEYTISCEGRTCLYEEGVADERKRLEVELNEATADSVRDRLLRFAAEARLAKYVREVRKWWDDQPPNGKQLNRILDEYDPEPAGQPRCKVCGGGRDHEDHTGGELRHDFEPEGQS